MSDHDGLESVITIGWNTHSRRYHHPIGQIQQPERTQDWIKLGGKVRARAALPHIAERDTPLGRWAKALIGRAHHNVAVVAFANKLARIAWAVLRNGERFTDTRTMAA